MGRALIFWEPSRGPTSMSMTIKRHSRTLAQARPIAPARSDQSFLGSRTLRRPPSSEPALNRRARRLLRHKGRRELPRRRDYYCSSDPGVERPVLGRPLARRKLAPMSRVGRYLGVSETG